MIRISYQEIEIDESLEKLLKDRMAESTCKTNLNSQLLFRQSYTGRTSKAFVGNWTKNGFWISRFRIQMFQFRPDLIANFRFYSGPALSRISIRYSIGLSSILSALFVIFAFSLPLFSLGKGGYITGLIFLSGIYIVLTVFELDSLKKAINKNILSGLEAKYNK